MNAPCFIKHQHDKSCFYEKQEKYDTFVTFCYNILKYNNFLLIKKCVLGRLFSINMNFKEIPQI